MKPLDPIFYNLAVFFKKILFWTSEKLKLSFGPKGSTPCFMASRLDVSTPWITASSSMAWPSVASAWRFTWQKKILVGKKSWRRARRRRSRRRAVQWRRESGNSKKATTVRRRQTYRPLSAGHGRGRRRDRTRTARIQRKARSSHSHGPAGRLHAQTCAGRFRLASRTLLGS